MTITGLGSVWPTVATSSHKASAVQNGGVDVELRQELLRRRDKDQRVRHLVSSRKGQHEGRLPDEVAAESQRVDDDNTRWLGDLLTTRGWPGQTLAGEDARRQRSCSPSTPTAFPPCSRHSWMPCAKRSTRALPLRHTWPTSRTGYESTPDSHGCMAPSSLSPAAPSGLIRSRTPGTRRTPRSSEHQRPTTRRPGLPCPRGNVRSWRGQIAVRPCREVRFAPERHMLSVADRAGPRARRLR